MDIRADDEDEVYPQTLGFGGFGGGLGSGFSSEYKSLATSTLGNSDSANAGIASLGLGTHSLGSMDSDSIFQLPSLSTSVMPRSHPQSSSSGPSAGILQVSADEQSAIAEWPKPFSQESALPKRLSTGTLSSSSTAPKTETDLGLAVATSGITSGSLGPTAYDDPSIPSTGRLPNSTRKSKPSVPAPEGDAAAHKQGTPVRANRAETPGSPVLATQRQPGQPTGGHSGPRAMGLNGISSGTQQSALATDTTELGLMVAGFASHTALKLSACARRGRGMWKALQFARMYDILWHCALVLCLMPVSLAWSLMTFVRSSNVPSAQTPQASIWAARRAFMSQVAVVVYLVHLVLHCSQHTRDWLAQTAQNNAHHLSVDWQPQQLLGVDNLHLPAAGFSPMEYVQRMVSLLADAVPLQAALLSGAIVWDHATHTWLSYKPLQRELLNLVLSGMCVGCCCLYSRTPWLAGVALPMLVVSALRSGRLVDKPRAAATQTPVTLSSLELLAIATVFFFCWGAP